MSLGCRSLDLPHLAPQGKRRVTGQRPPHPSLLGLDHHTQLSLCRPTNKVNLGSLRAVSLQLPQLLVHQALYVGSIHLPLQWLGNVRQQLFPRMHSLGHLGLWPWTSWGRVVCVVPHN